MHLVAYLQWYVFFIYLQSYPCIKQSKTATRNTDLITKKKPTTTRTTTKQQQQQQQHQMTTRDATYGPAGSIS